MHTHTSLAAHPKSSTRSEPRIKMIEERSEKSLCEKSMKMVVNIIKLSSFSIAKMSLGAARNLSPATATGSDTVSDELQKKPQLRSEKVQSRSRTYSFVMQPENESLMVHEENRDSDGIFDAYIKKVHDKNRSNLQEASKLSPYIVPPPPTPFIK